MYNQKRRNNRNWIWVAIAAAAVTFVVILLLGYIVIKRRDVAVVSKWYGKFAVCIFYATVAISIIFKDFLAENTLVATLIFIPAVACAIAAFAGYVKHYAYLKQEAPQRGYVLKNRKEQ